MEQEAEQVIDPDADGMAKAIRVLRRGGLVAFPTETVYGLGADARKDEAVASIFEAKGRPTNNPLILHVKNFATANLYGRFDELAFSLAEQFWPGPLTLVVPRRDELPLSPLVSAGLDTIALRVPGDEVAHALLTGFDGPVAAPSANRSGMLSPTEAEHVEEMLGADLVPVILDGGACERGLESTILGFEQGRCLLLRSGIISKEQIEEFLGEALEAPASPRDSAIKSAVPSAPGQFSSHYAPRARLRLNAQNGNEGELMLAFGPDAPKGTPGVNLSPTGDLTEAAVNLYAYLHLLDDTGVATIAVMAIPHEGLGEAINDRLTRAAAPRPEESL